MIPLVGAAFAQVGVLDLGGGATLAPHGFVDVGWFDVGGDGTSYAYDRTEPQDGTWVYSGDPWAATINSQGDPGDLGNRFNNLQRHDRIASGGRPTFLVNTIEQSASVASPLADIELGIWVEPGRGVLGASGDDVSLDRGWIRLHPRDDQRLSLDVGKVESVVGQEWWFRRAPERPGVTPSIVARYTTGTPVGLAGHAVAWDRRLRLDLGLANGSPTTERYGHFAEDLDSNVVPTTSARVGLRPLGTRSALEVGAGGWVGAQDGVPEGVLAWQVGGDLALNLRSFYVRAEYLLSDQDQGGDDVTRLRAHGGYVEVWGHAGGVFAPHVRVDRRAADLFVAEVRNRYVSDMLRATVGARFDLDFHLAVKAELVHVFELRGVELRDDVVTTSLVARY